ncbi:unnamed protein product [Dicrocoelium dendriticum]|nr:unnamed protein product [Dicrocoelium dendriticum]
MVFRDVFHNCSITGPIGDVTAHTQYVNGVDDYKVLPRITSILRLDFFYYFEVNLERGCPFFKEDMRCGLKDCRVSGCSVEEIPEGMRSEHPSLHYPSHHMVGGTLHNGFSTQESTMSRQMDRMMKLIANLANWTAP